MDDSPFSITPGDTLLDPNGRGGAPGTAVDLAVVLDSSIPHDAHDVTAPHDFWRWDVDAKLICHSALCPTCANYLTHLDDADPSWQPACLGRDHWLSSFEQVGITKAQAQNARDAVKRSIEVSKAHDVAKAAIADTELTVANVLADKNEAVRNRDKARAMTQQLQIQVNAAEDKNKTLGYEVEVLNEKRDKLLTELAELRIARARNYVESQAQEQKRARVSDRDEEPAHRHDSEARTSYVPSTTLGDWSNAPRRMETHSLVLATFVMTWSGVAP
ncbi:hypothetical protein BC834DRAFT_847469 [Gloeopeniophorella convolvens]|nr:hypothetical protein BC834DRAFT_847469 [Gloeopeniophorella convolvens]